MSVRWHIVTPELPPECGGVGDYGPGRRSAGAKRRPRLCLLSGRALTLEAN
jgi:hypothetical protein